MPLSHAIEPIRHPALQAIAVSKGFVSGRQRTQVLDGLSLSIEAAELTLISGPSGCGKSTLLAILSGLQQVDSGHVRALDSELGQLDLRALEQVELPLNHMGLSRNEARQRARQSLEEVGLAPRMHLRPSELSGGEKQRVAIARALAKEPQLLFADEPTSALDAANGQIIIDILHRIAHSHGTTVLCVSHDPRLVVHADRVLAMEDGSILSDRRNPAPVIDSKRAPS
jgi:putative ABC transport system ATP-binding protein